MEHPTRIESGTHALRCVANHVEEAQERLRGEAR